MLLADELFLAILFSLVSAIRVSFSSFFWSLGVVSLDLFLLVRIRGKRLRSFPSDVVRELWIFSLLVSFGGALSSLGFWRLFGVRRSDWGGEI